MPSFNYVETPDPQELNALVDIWEIGEASGCYYCNGCTSHEGLLINEVEL